MCEGEKDTMNNHCIRGVAIAGEIQRGGKRYTRGALEQLAAILKNQRPVFDGHPSKGREAFARDPENRVAILSGGRIDDQGIVRADLYLDRARWSAVAEAVEHSPEAWALSPIVVEYPRHQADGSDSVEAISNCLAVDLLPAGQAAFNANLFESYTPSKGTAPMSTATLSRPRGRIVTLLERVAQDASSALNKDRATVSGVKVINRDSKNGRSYSDRALDRLCALISEGCDVYVNHPGAQGQADRDAADKFGQLRNPRRVDGGVVADLHYIRAHPMAPIIEEALERNMPSHVGLSVNARGSVTQIGGKSVVDDIESLVSTDLVARPATTKSLLEGDESGDDVEEDESDDDDLSAQIMAIANDSLSPEEMKNALRNLLSDEDADDVPAETVEDDDPNMVTAEQLRDSVNDTFRDPPQGVEDRIISQKMLSYFLSSGETFAKSLQGKNGLSGNASNVPAGGFGPELAPNASSGVGKPVELSGNARGPARLSAPDNRSLFGAIGAPNSGPASANRTLAKPGAVGLRLESFSESLRRPSPAATLREVVGRATKRPATRLTSATIPKSTSEFCHALSRR